MYNSPRTFPAPFPMKFAGMDLLLDEIPVAATSLHPSPHHHHHHHRHRHLRYQPDIDGSDYRHVPLLQPSDHHHHHLRRYSNNHHHHHLYDTSAIGSDPSTGSGSLSPDSPIQTAALLNHDELDLIKRLRSFRVDEAGSRSPRQRLHYGNGHGHGHGHSRVPSYPNPDAAALPQLLYSNQVPGPYPNPGAAVLWSRPAAVADDTVILHGRQFRNVHYVDPVPVTPPPAAAAAAKGYIYWLAKDQNGCRFLQRKLVEGTSKEVEAIFLGIIDHVAELMVNPFANYLVQKVLDVCTEEQRLRVVLVLTQHRMELVRICLSNHGTRAVQRLIETLKTRQQIGLVVAALKPGFLDLTKDLNGNHVIQRCLLCLPNEDKKFIFDAAAKHCVEIATHQHGCCVMQRCIGSSTGEHRTRLVGEISANGLHLAQDAFGNYVVQYTLDLKHPTATANFASQFQGNYVNLSMQKFSSNVVEKCLKVFGDNHQVNIVLELLSVPRLDQLLQDPYANYVFQCALATTKKGGALHSALLKAIKPHASVLLTSPYSKKIYNMLKE